MSFRSKLVGVLALCLLLVGVVSAQGGFIAYGQTVAGTVSDQSPVVLYTFQGNAGDLVAVDVSATSPGLDPTLTLLSPGGVPLVNNDNNPFSFSVGDSGLTYQLTETGVYSLLVGSANNTRGTFNLRLIPRANSVTPVTLSGAAQVDLVTGPQTILVTGNPGGVTPILFQASPVETAFSVEVRNPSGQIIAILIGFHDFTLPLPAATGNFAVVINAATPGTPGLVVVSQGAASSATSSPPAPVATEEVSAPAGPPANICSATPAAGAVNVRSGPGTEYNVLATMQVGQYFEVVGQNAGWYVVMIPGGIQGWVAGSVTTLNGPCANLPFMQAPAAPQQPAAPTSAPSATPVTGGEQPTQPVQPTQPSQPTEPPPPTATQAAPTAPPDSNTRMVVPLDGSISLSDFVSFPNGDVEDVVSYDTSGLNPNQALPGGRGQLSIALVCSGNGSNFIIFRIDGRDYTCGQTFERTVNADSDTGAVRIIASGGDATYVQWTLNATLTRITN